MYADYRCHVDDGAFTLAEHDGKHGVDEVERALEVYGDNGVPLLLGHAHHEAVFGDAGVVDKDVDAAKVVLDLINDFFGLFKIGGIRGVAFNLYAEGGDFGFGLLAVFVNYEVGESDVCAFLGETQGKGFADAAGRAGDEGGLSFEKFHRVYILCLNEFSGCKVTNYFRFGNLGGIINTP